MQSSKSLFPAFGSNRRKVFIRGITLFSLVLVGTTLFTYHGRLPSPSEEMAEAVREPENTDPWAWNVKDLKNTGLSDYSHGGDVTYPPSWAKMDHWEDNLPQHNFSLPVPEGKQGRYLNFACQNKFYGWNNVLNELLMNSFLAYESKRAYVFQDYWWFARHNMWHGDRSKWPDPNAAEWKPRTPLNALISGPTTGMAWDEGDPAPRSVHERYWKKVCPEDEVHVIYTSEIKPTANQLDGIDLFNHWKQLLLNSPERCIEIRPSSDDVFPQVFDLMLWGSTRVLSLWESFSKSPVTRLLTASHIVISALARNEYIFYPTDSKPAGSAPRDPFNRMLSAHIRRGDYIDHCTNLANWNASFYSWNSFPTMPDIFHGPPPPPGGQPYGTNSEENKKAFMVHCLPSIEQIVQKIRKSREDYIRAGNNRVLDVIYLLTNDRTQWLEDLKALLRADGWHTIRTSRDLELDQVQLDVSNAVDMEIARKSAVFVGNGWSSFTSNINYRRLADGREPISMRFW